MPRECLQGEAPASLMRNSDLPSALAQRYCIDAEDQLRLHPQRPPPSQGINIPFPRVSLEVLPDLTSELHCPYARTGKLVRTALSTEALQWAQEVSTVFQKGKGTFFFVFRKKSIQNSLHASRCREESRALTSARFSALFWNKISSPKAHLHMF